jgi:hypothetical protein
LKITIIKKVDFRVDTLAFTIGIIFEEELIQALAYSS